MPLSKKHQVLIERVMTGVPNLVRVRKVLCRTEGRSRPGEGWEKEPSRQRKQQV